MNTISSSEIKRRGIRAVDELMKNGPVHIIRNNIPDYVVLTEESYKMIIWTTVPGTGNPSLAIFNYGVV